jgi:hypothetical protein
MTLQRWIAQLEALAPPKEANPPPLTMAEREVRLAALLARVGSAGIPAGDPRVAQLAAIVATNGGDDAA